MDMFAEFIKFLKINYEDTVTEISRTGERNCKNKCNPKGNKFIIDDEFKMIDLDCVADDFNPSTENLKTVDGLYVCQKDEKTHFYLIEFKKMPLDEPHKLPLTLSYLRKARKKTPVEKFDEFARSVMYSEDFNSIQDFQGYKVPINKVNGFLDSYDGCKKYLSDRTKEGLKNKPVTSLILLHQVYNQFLAYKNSNTQSEFDIRRNYANNYFENKVAFEDFVNIKYHYIIVFEYNGISESPLHLSNECIQYFNFMENLKPYPFTTTVFTNNKYFVEKVLPAIKSI